ncbi:MAG: APH(3') family aminoglycoside O-phosphotransferase [Chloroflexota bacterium]
MENLPAALRDIVDSSEVTPITVGHSADAVYRLQGDETYYLKIGVSLRDECERLQWLEGKLPVPKLVHFEINDGKHYLLTTAVHGQMLFETGLPIKQCLDIYAEAAHMWHQLPIGNCPFQWRIPQQIDDARHRLNNEQINPDKFDVCYYGKSALELFADLLNAMPDEEEDLAITHGDFCLPNVLIDPETHTITGFVDVGQMGISDRHLDLVLASRSIAYNFGSKYIPYFYEQYGIAENPAKRHFYCILNEFV